MRTARSVFTGVKCGRWWRGANCLITFDISAWTAGEHMLIGSHHRIFHIRIIQCFEKRRERDIDGLPSGLFVYLGALPYKFDRLFLHAFH